MLCTNAVLGESTRDRDLLYNQIECSVLIGIGRDENSHISSAKLLLPDTDPTEIFN
jgi:hypothetical protein